MRTSKSEYRYKTVIKRCFFGLKKHLFLMRFFAKKAFDCVYKPQAPSRVLRLYFYFAGLFPRLCTPKEKRKMKRTNKKGFTIVELVIVIAVIAILAAVLIPNISKLVQKANTSADESLVRNLNTALSMDVEKHTTMSEALKAAKDNGGYDLETIELKGKGNKILWDSVNDCFVCLKGTDRVYLPNTQSVKKASEMN